MGAGFGDFAVADDEDEVGIADSGEAVGDDEGGAAAHEGVEGVLDEAFAFGIEGAGGFVEDEDGGIAKDGAGDGDALTLATGEFDAAFTDDGFVAVGEGGDEIMGIGLARGGFDLVLGGVPAGAGVGDVFPDAAAEKDDILRDEGHTGAKLPERIAAGRLAIDKDLTGVRIKEAEEQVDDGGFTGAAGADEGDTQAGLGGEGDIFEDGNLRPGGISEADVLKLNPALKLKGGMLHDISRSDGLVRLLGFAQHFLDTLRCAESFLEVGVELREGAKGATDEDGVKDEPGKITDAHRALIDEAGAKPDDNRDGAEESEDDEGNESSAVFGPLKSGGDEIREAIPIAAGLEILTGESFDRLNALQGLLNRDVRGGEAVLSEAGKLADLRADDDGDNDRRRQGGEHDEGELEIERQHENEPAGGGDELAQNHGHLTDERLLNEGDVRGETAGQFTHAALIKEGHGQPDEVAVGIPAQGGDGFLSHFIEPHDAEERDAGLEGEQAEDEGGHAIEGAEPAGLRAFTSGDVQEQADEPRKGERKTGRENESAKGKVELLPVGRQIGEKTARALQLRLGDPLLGRLIAGGGIRIRRGRGGCRFFGFRGGGGGRRLFPGGKRRRRGRSGGKI